MLSRRTTFRILALVATAIVAIGCSDETGRSVEAFERLRASSAELIEAVRDLGEAQGAQITERAEAYLEELDRDIAELREQTGEEAAKRLRQLEEQRQALAPKIEALREATGQAWEDARARLVDELEEFGGK
ncbi:MAG: hypothetical protein AAFZ65_06375 [Planctomycetota bacterium]